MNRRFLGLILLLALLSSTSCQNSLANNASPSQSFLKPNESSLPTPHLQKTSALKVRAYPLKAVTPLSGQQTIYIVVLDQTLVPVEDVQISLALRLPSGERRLYFVKDPTDANGITKITFPFTSDIVGLVQITVEAQRNRLDGVTTTSFRIWW